MQIIFILMTKMIATLWGANHRDPLTSSIALVDLLLPKILYRIDNLGPYQPLRVVSSPRIKLRCNDVNAVALLIPICGYFTASIKFMFSCLLHLGVRATHFFVPDQPHGLASTVQNSEKKQLQLSPVVASSVLPSLETGDSFGCFWQRFYLQCFTGKVKRSSGFSLTNNFQLILIIFYLSSYQSYKHKI